MKIKNFDHLAQTPLRRAALTWAEGGLQAIDTKTAVGAAVSWRGDGLLVGEKFFPLAEGGRLLVVGAGKCSLDAAAALEEILGERIAGGLVIDVRCDEPLKRIESCQGNHPLPTDANVDHTRRLIELLDGAGSNDLVLVIVSGGGSTLLCQPGNSTCQDEAAMIERLFDAGATIQEINTVRKHLSLARGGNLARHAFPARVVGLIFSDVPGDDLSLVASGPTVRDETTLTDAAALCGRFGLPVGDLMETPKDDKYFSAVTNILLVSNQTALVAMSQAASADGFHTEICSHCLQGEAAVVGRELVARLRDAPPRHRPFLRWGDDGGW